MRGDFAKGFPSLGELTGRTDDGPAGMSDAQIAHNVALWAAHLEGVKSGG